MTERNRDFMTCEIIKDLLPLYADGICSEESAAQIKEHLEECEECRRKLEHYQASIAQKDTQDAKEDDMLRPMKKVKRKLRRHKWLSVTLGIFLTILLAGLGVLTVGEINGHVISFTTCTNIIRLNYITHQLTKGNTDVLLNALSFRIEDVYAVKGVSNFEDMKAYKEQVKKQMDEAYAYYFEGKDISVKLSDVEMQGYAYDDSSVFVPSSSIYMYDFYEEKNHVLSMWFFDRDGKYYIEESGLDDISAEHSPSFSSSSLPMEEILKEISRYAIKRRYDDFSQNKEIKNSTPLTLLFRKFSDETDEENGYSQDLRKRTIALYEKGWAVKEFMYTVDSYDEKLGRWFYKLLFVFENPETGESCMMEQQFICYDAFLYAVEDKPAVILYCTESVSQEIRNLFLHYFE